MAFSDDERTAIRRYCGYGAFGADPTGFGGWRFFQQAGLLEYRMSNLSASEETVTRQYLTQLATLETEVTTVGDRLDTAQAAVWTRNPAELRERLQLFDTWRRRLCGFLGIPPGAELGPSGVRVVV